MGYYTHKDKVSGDGLALTEWNTLSTAVAGNSGLTLALTPGDKVGIGTSSPSAKLTVVGDVNIGGNGNGRLKVRHIDGKLHTSDTFEHLYLNWDTEKDVNVGGGKDTNLNVFGKIYTKGNVGIGMSPGNEKLEVAGKVKASHFVGDGSGLTNLSVGLTGLNLATTSGNVGIGTSSPLTKLHVNGRSYFEEGGDFMVLWPQDGAIIGKASRNIRLGFATDHNASGWVERMRIESKTGNVGIGTQAPTAKLEVNGTLKATQYLGINLAWGPIEQTGWINNLDKVMNYKLPDGCVMVGLYSEHSNDKEDRMFMIFYRTLRLSGI